MPFEAFVTQPYFEWLRIDAGAPRAPRTTGAEPYANETLVDLDATFVRSASTLRGEALPRLDHVLFDAPALAQFDATAGKIRYVAAAVSPPTNPPPVAQANLVLVAGPDGTVSSPSACGQQRYGARFAAAARAAGPNTTPEAALLRAIADPSSEAGIVSALAGEQPNPDWSSLPPEHRLVNLETTPSEVLDRFVRSEMYISPPREWRDLDFAFCTRTAIGWTDFCAAANSAPSDELPIPLTVTFVPGDDLELVAADSRLATERPLAVIGTVRTDAGTGDLLVALSGPPAQSVDELVAAAERHAITADFQPTGGQAIPFARLVPADAPANK